MNTCGVKKAVRLRDGNCCRDCGLTNEDHLNVFGRSLHVHRLVPGSQYTLDGCVLVCNPCHSVRHGAKAVTARPRKLHTTRTPAVHFRLTRRDLEILDEIRAHLSDKIGLRLTRSQVVTYAVRMAVKKIPEKMERPLDLI